MASINLKSLIENCYLGGQNSITSFRKVPAIASAASNVVDFSLAPGNPRPNFYTGAQLSATLFNSAYGVWHGGDVAPATKILRNVNFMLPPATITPMEFYVLDYLMFYPLIDMDSTDPQEFDNTITLPRYSDGEGVKAFLVATNPYVGNAQFYIEYVNQNDEVKVTELHTSNASTFIGTIITSGAGANNTGTFIKTQNGEGIKRVNSITFMSPNGGLAALVLCKPITTVSSVWPATQTNLPHTQLEWDCLLMKGELPIIKDGAYLNFIAQCNGSAAGVVISGLIETVWS